MSPKVGEPHVWLPMPGYPGETFCANCKVVKAMCGTDTCAPDGTFNPLDPEDSW